ncbi:TetR/AcrR family transcriptional regulator [Lactiplantibacillus paraplantarum]|uniref:TetR/AcrR family transcriptional regulator n=1 Tax=Lactiplantibacillus paraplantarum TaxID=60520 RepID=A0A4Q9Y6I2_9LACO|nr:TetR/AcrR family transcriptional regulator [Lactiplantibacillus paraplantarum]
MEISFREYIFFLSLKSSHSLLIDKTIIKESSFFVNRKQTEYLWFDTELKFFYSAYMKEKNEQRRQDILDATVQMINAEGLGGITMTKVAKKAAISQSNIYIYFENKEDLVKQAFLSRKQKMSDYLFAHFNAQASALDNLALFARALYQFAADNPEDADLIQQFQAAPIMATLDLSQDEAGMRFDDIVAALDKGIESGEIRSIDPRVILAMGTNTLLSYERMVRLHQVDPVTTPLSVVIEMILTGCAN